MMVKSKIDEMMNVVAEDIQDALLFTGDSLIESWMLDLGMPFYSFSHKKLMKNYGRNL